MKHYIDTETRESIKYDLPCVIRILEKIVDDVEEASVGGPTIIRLHSRERDFIKYGLPDMVEILEQIIQGAQKIAPDTSTVTQAYHDEETKKLAQRIREKDKTIAESEKSASLDRREMRFIHEESAKLQADNGMLIQRLRTLEEFIGTYLLGEQNANK